MTGRLPAAALVANGLAAAGLTAATLLAQREDRLADQLGWLTLAIAALLVGVLGDVGVLLDGRRRLAARRALLRPAGVPAVQVRPEGGDLVRAQGQRHFHRASCLLVAGRATQQDDRDGHASAGRQPCRACRP